MASKADLDVLEVLSNSVAQQLLVLSNTWENEFHTVDAELSGKAEWDEVATREQVDALRAAMAAKADTEWAQEQLEGITRILLPATLCRLSSPSAASSSLTRSSSRAS